MKQLRIGLSAVAVLCLGMGLTPVASAQQQPPPANQKAAQKAVRSTTPSATAPANAEQGAPAKSEGQLRQRVEQLEEQLVDLQVTIGTLESLARTTGGSSSSVAARPTFGGGAVDQSGTAARVDGLEIQLRALVGQVEQLNDQVRALNGRRSATPDGLSDLRPVPAPPPRVAMTQPAPSSGFGSTTVTPVGNDPIGRILTDDATRPPAVVGNGGADGGSPKQLYETAYGYLLQQNYGAAEAAFDDFLARHPNDGLAGNAQYWLGESYFVRGQFKQAAGAFLKGYQTYGRSIKAPDSLLKLAMSLDRLGQKDAACSSYAELNTRFPAAAPTVKARAESERRRIGC